MLVWMDRPSPSTTPYMDGWMDRYWAIAYACCASCVLHIKIKYIGRAFWGSAHFWAPTVKFAVCDVCVCHGACKSLATRLALSFPCFLALSSPFPHPSATTLSPFPSPLVLYPTQAALIFCHLLPLPLSPISPLLCCHWFCQQRPSWSNSATKPAHSS